MWEAVGQVGFTDEIWPSLCAGELSRQDAWQCPHCPPPQCSTSLAASPNATHWLHPLPSPHALGTHLCGVETVGQSSALLGADLPVLLPCTSTQGMGQQRCTCTRS